MVGNNPPWVAFPNSLVSGLCMIVTTLWLPSNTHLLHLRLKVSSGNFRNIVPTDWRSASTRLDAKW